MNGLELKRILLDNPNMIKSVLEDLGCTHIKITSRYITSTRPYGNNTSSVYIKLNELLTSNCFTKQSEFESKYEKRDFIELVCFFKDDCSVMNSIKYICNVCNIDKDIKFEKKPVSNSISFLTKFKKATHNQPIDDDTPIDESLLDDFMYYPSYDFYRDNISIEVQEEFGVCYDIMDNRVCFPIRNRFGQLISIKGRTLNNDYKSLGIPKYIYYENFHGGNLLYGEYENRKWLDSCDEIIIVESEKGVQQLASYGIRNAVATCKKSITRQQLLRLLSYGKGIVIAYDKDVKEDELKIECDKFKGLIPTSYILDELNLLNDKESPTDKGEDIFKWLLNDFKIEYKKVI